MAADADREDITMRTLPEGDDRWLEIAIEKISFAVAPALSTELRYPSHLIGIKARLIRAPCRRWDSASASKSESAALSMSAFQPWRYNRGGMTIYTGQNRGEYHENRHDPYGNHNRIDRHSKPPLQQLAVSTAIQPTSLTSIKGGQTGQPSEVAPCLGARHQAYRCLGIEH